MEQTALEFVFNSSDLKALAEKGPTIKFTVYVEEATTTAKEKVGVLRIKAHAQDNGNKKIMAAAGETVQGVPCPPCIPPKG